MLNTIKILLFGIVFLTACTEKKAKSEDMSEDAIQEIKNIENQTSVLEVETRDMEQTAKELDSLLNELEK